MATYRYGVVRSRIAASQLVARAGKRFESARRLSSFWRLQENSGTQRDLGAKTGANLPRLAE